jgi:DNA invertase Pin-like site-specific DNA recombinase
VTQPTLTETVASLSEPSRPRVAAYLLVPCDDDAKAASLRERLASFQRTQGMPLGMYEEQCGGHRARPLRGRLVRRGSRGGFDLVCVLALRHLAPTRARIAQLVLRLGVPVVTLSGLRLDPADRVVRWIARERSEHQRRIRRGLSKKRQRGERAGVIPAGLQLAEDGVHLEPDPNVQRAMATARELSASGLALRQIAKRLTEAGHRTRRGTAISHKQVGRWLRATASRGSAASRRTL